jgi:hypothetical protein
MARTADGGSDSDGRQSASVKCGKGRGAAPNTEAIAQLDAKLLCGIASENLWERGRHTRRCTSPACHKRTNSIVIAEKIAIRSARLDWVIRNAAPLLERGTRLCVRIDGRRGEILAWRIRSRPPATLRLSAGVSSYELAKLRAPGFRRAALEIRCV